MMQVNALKFPQFPSKISPFPENCAIIPRNIIFQISEMEPFYADISTFEKIQNEQNARTGYGHLAGFNDVRRFREQNTVKRAVAESKDSRLVEKSDPLTPDVGYASPQIIQVKSD
jgi:hypothetical protein